MWSGSMFLDHSINDTGPVFSGSVQSSASDSYYDLGLACFSAKAGLNTVEAHMWFNLAAMHGDRRGIEARAEIADLMSAREISEAQRRARIHRNQ
jgi:hypothetical protein